MYFFISATTEVFPANISFSSLLTREILSSLKNARLFSREKMSSQKSFVLWLLINYIKKYVLVFFINALTKQVRLSLTACAISVYSLFTREILSSHNALAYPVGKKCPHKNRSSCGCIFYYH